MGIGKRIKYFRKLRGMTQQELGCAMEFSENSADARIGQYEGGQRKPKKKMIEKLAQVLSVHPQAISPLEVETRTGLAHTLFLLEDMYGLSIDSGGRNLCLKLKLIGSEDTAFLEEFTDSWAQKRAQLSLRKITPEEYNHWRYNYHSDLTKLPVKEETSLQQLLCDTDPIFHDAIFSYLAMKSTQQMVDKLNQKYNRENPHLEPRELELEFPWLFLG